MKAIYNQRCVIVYGMGLDIAQKYLIRIKRKGDADMSQRAEIIFMQVRLLRLASEEWNTSIQKVNALFDQYSILKFIEECYDVFHMEGDYAVLDEIKTVLKNKGVNVNAGII